MNNKFDELTKVLAQSITRRAALKQFGVGLAGVALASLGFGFEAQAKRPPKWVCDCSGRVPNWGCDPKDRKCISYCASICS